MLVPLLFHLLALGLPAAIPVFASSLDASIFTFNAVAPNFTRDHENRRESLKAYEDDWAFKHVYHNPQVDCYREESCLPLAKHTCRAGYTRVGFDTGACNGWKNHQKPYEQDDGQPICCADTSIAQFPPGQTCRWMGGAKNCDEAGMDGDVVLFQSKWGGLPVPINHEGYWKRLKRCEIGHKFFVCPLPNVNALASSCRWSECQKGCAPTVHSAIHTNYLDYFVSGCVQKKFWHAWEQDLQQDLCCYRQKIPLTKCRYVGSRLCTNNQCNPETEVTLTRSRFSGYHHEFHRFVSNKKLRKDPWPHRHCNQWDTYQSICCTPDWDALESDECGVVGTCDVRKSYGNDGICAADPFAEDWVPDGVKLPPSPADLSKREAMRIREEATGEELAIMMRPFPAGSALQFAALQGWVEQSIFNFGSQNCSTAKVSPGLSFDKIEDFLGAAMSREYVADTVIDKHFYRDVMEAALNGVLPSGKQTRMKKISAKTLARYLPKGPSEFPFVVAESGSKVAEEASKNKGFSAPETDRQRFIGIDTSPVAAVGPDKSRALAAKQDKTSENFISRENMSQPEEAAEKGSSLQKKTTGVASEQKTVTPEAASPEGSDPAFIFPELTEEDILRLEPGGPFPSTASISSLLYAISLSPTQALNAKTTIITAAAAAATTPIIPLTARFQAHFANTPSTFLLSRSIAARKRIILSHGLPLTHEEFHALFDPALQTGLGETPLLTVLRETIGVFHYLHHPGVLSRTQATRKWMAREADKLAQLEPEMAEFGHIWRAVDAEWWDVHAQRTREWLEGRFEFIRMTYEAQNQKMREHSKRRRPEKGRPYILAAVENWGIIWKALNGLEKDFRDVVKTLPRLEEYR